MNGRELARIVLCLHGRFCRIFGMVENIGLNFLSKLVS